MRTFLPVKRTKLFFLLPFFIFLFDSGFSQAPVFTTDLPIVTYGCVGSTITLSVVASNNPTSYYWQYTTLLSGPYSPTRITDNVTYSGSGTASLSIVVSTDLQNYKFQCVASNASGPTSSKSAQLLVSTGPPPEPSGIFGFGNYTDTLAPDTIVCLPGSSAQIQYTMPADNAPLYSGQILYPPLPHYASNRFTTSYWAYSGSGATFYWYFGQDSVYASIITDTARITFSPNATSGILSVTPTNACGSAPTVSIPIHINQVQPTLVAAPNGTTVCDTRDFSYYYINNNTMTDTSCNLISNITMQTTNTVTSCVTIDQTVQAYNGTPYVQRHYNIEATTNPTTTAATLTLYYLQQEFDNYNAARGVLPALPTGPGDAAGISNLRVTQYHGTGTTPGTYVGTAGEIDPDDNNIVWNATASRWEVTFNITGFSGFYVSTGSLLPLPLTLLDFKGEPTVTGNLLKWITTSEVNVADFEIQRSEDGINFTSVGKMAAVNNSSLTNNYSYTDNFASGSATLYYYRLKMTDLDEKFSYSKVILLKPYPANLSVKISPNPFHQTLTVVVTSPIAANAIITVTDVRGKQVLIQNSTLIKGTNTIALNEAAQLQSGIYFFNINTGSQKQIVKVVKE